MEATKILMKEHEIIKTVIRNLHEDLLQMEVINEEKFRPYQQFFSQYADHFHHGKEENIYFPWILGKRPDLESGPVGMMLREHELMRELFGQSIVLARNENFKEFFKKIGNFCEMLYEHIYKEDQILYGIADQLDSQFGGGDSHMLSAFKELEKQNSAVKETWENIALHPEVMKESAILLEGKNKKGGHSGCCGSCGG